MTMVNTVTTASDVEPVALTVEVRRAGTLLGTAAVSAAPCIEDARFRAVLTGMLPNDDSGPSFTVTPMWAEAGPPVVAGLQVAAGARVSRIYDRRVFASRAYAIVAQLLRARQLERDDEVEWQVVATAKPASRFRARVTRAPYPFRTGPVPEAQPGTVAIVVEAGVLDAVHAAVLASPAIEWAGLLLGDLVLDETRGAARLTARTYMPVTVGRGGASGSHFAFDAGTFLAARRAVASGIPGSDVIGWGHQHPPCERCPTTPTCTAETIFFSDDDVRVHAAAFQSAYMVALVAGKLAERRALEPGVRLYEWSGGKVVERALEPRDGSLVSISTESTEETLAPRPEIAETVTPADEGAAR